MSEGSTTPGKAQCVKHAERHCILCAADSKQRHSANHSVHPTVHTVHSHLGGCAGAPQHHFLGRKT